MEAHPALERVHYVVVDPGGIARGKWAPASSLAKAFDPAGGINFPLSIHGLDVWGNEVAETGLHISSGDRDGFFRAVPQSLSTIPGKGDTAQVILEAYEPDGTPFMGCPRQVLRRAKGGTYRRFEMQATMAFELEFHLLAPDGRGGWAVAEPASLRAAQRMYDLRSLDSHQAIIDAVAEAAATAGLPVDTVVKEAAPGQYEINLAHRTDNPIAAADDAVLLRRVVAAAAQAHGLRATFMAKPFLDQPGNGMHLHCSLKGERGLPLFGEDTGPQSELAHAATGLVDTMADATLVLANTVNGFRRLAPGSYAPTHANWGTNNRSVAVRVPTGTPRLEHRVAGADANPYLVAALVLAGMEYGMRPRPTVPPLAGNAYEDADPGPALPTSLGKALALWDASSFAEQALGPVMKANLAHLKRAEIEGFTARISPFETETYL